MSAESAHKSVPLPQEVVTVAEGAETPDAAEKLYQQICAALKEQDAPGRHRWAGLLLFLTMIVFALSVASVYTPVGLAVLLGVIFLHETGHYVGMRLFGYRNVRMFFIPFFGAAVSGGKHAAPAWQTSIIVLLGPLPGIALAALLYAIFGAGIEERPWMRVSFSLLLVLNGFNLLPVVPLDGGQLLKLLIFCRHPLLESVFLLVSGLGLGLLAWGSHAWVLVLPAAVPLIAVPFAYQKWRWRRALWKELPQLPVRLEDLTEHQRRGLFHYCRALSPAGADASDLADRIKAVHEAAVAAPPTFLVSVGLFALYAAGCVAGPLVWIGYLDATLELEDQIFDQTVLQMKQLDREAGQLLQEVERLFSEAQGQPVEARHLGNDAARLNKEAAAKADQAIRLWEDAEPHLKDIAILFNEHQGGRREELRSLLQRLKGHKERAEVFRRRSEELMRGSDVQSR